MDIAVENSFSHSRVLVTGGLGFIGHHFVNLFATRFPQAELWNLDRISYCSGSEGIDEAVRGSPRYHFVRGDIRDLALVKQLLVEHEIQYIFHIAASTHVEDSFENNNSYTDVNVMGTLHLLEASRQYGKLKRFIHVSTDEVYGESLDEVPVGEDTTVMRPTSPYAASKAAGELLVFSFFKSFQLPTVVARPVNAYGPGQHPEKLIPHFSTLLKENKKLTIQGTGLARRMFCHVKDTAEAFLFLGAHGVLGEAYNVVGHHEFTVLDIARQCHGLWQMAPNANGFQSPPFGDSSLLESSCPDNSINSNTNDVQAEDYMVFVKDRQYNDCRYLLSGNKLASLGWVPKHTNFPQLLLETIHWYTDIDRSSYWGK